jgi:UTP--glucose-1-phosphate uridylyltransferase
MPVAGLGTAFLPVTKALPKEMLPIVDRPLIQYAVDEAAAAGIRELILVTHRSKRAIEDYFDRATEIERELERRGRHRELAQLRQFSNESLHIAYARQPSPRGLGDAIRCARHLIGDEPFAVILPDNLLEDGARLLAEMIARCERTRSSVIAVQPISGRQGHRLGMVELSQRDGEIERFAATPASTRSGFGLVGRYVFTPAIFESLDGLEPAANGEIQLSDAIASLLSRERVSACKFSGQRFDCGTRLGFLQANIAYASRDPQLGAELRAFVAETFADAQDPADSVSSSRSPRSRLSLASS